MRKAIATFALAATLGAVSPLALGQTAAPPVAQGKAAASAQAEAALALIKLLPKGAQPTQQNGKMMIKLADGVVREPTAEEQAALVNFMVATQSAEKQKRDDALAELTPQERTDLEKAQAGISLALESGARLSRQGDEYEIRLANGTTRAPNDGEAAAIAAFDAVTDKIEARLREAAIEKAPLRIVADATQEGKTGQAKKWNPIISQTMVFNQAAKLTEAIVRKNSTTIPAGTTLFGATQKGVKHYCLPKDGFMSDVILCFHDSDGDGKLDRETNGGTPLNGVYMFASGFGDRGAVSKPASFVDIPYMEGHKQQIGIICTNIRTNSKDGVTTAYFFVAVSAGKSWTTVGTNGTPVKLDAAGKGKLNLMGAEIEVTRIDNNTLSYNVVKAFPEQPYALTKVVTYR